MPKFKTQKTSKKIKKTNSHSISGLNPELQGLALDTTRGAGRVIRTTALIGLGTFAAVDGINRGLTASEKRAAKKAAKAAKKAAKRS